MRPFADPGTEGKTLEMGDAKPAKSVLLICGIIAVDDRILAEAKSKLVAARGSIDLESEVFSFDSTAYYIEEMGRSLVRQFVSFKELIDPSSLADIKRFTNRLEEGLATHGENGPARQANIDPGYITPAKLVLATTKDFSHRIYLREGIYAEVTLGFAKEGRRNLPWTYPDFASGRYDAFLLAVREVAMAGG
ncbi:MAG: DUF4416 family protein [Lentisphaerae bacterium]|nr:DUF4416 family protein [Lentisphaerota bacterium]